MYRRPREGAWIEMSTRRSVQPVASVAPVRGRGLKYGYPGTGCGYPGRPREGAWIEIFRNFNFHIYLYSRPREGAWIEIRLQNPPWGCSPVAPVRGRGLKSSCRPFFLYRGKVAPVRGRGLKCPARLPCLAVLSRPREGAWIEISSLIYTRPSFS